MLQSSTSKSHLVGWDYIFQFLLIFCQRNLSCSWVLFEINRDIPLPYRGAQLPSNTVLLCPESRIWEQVTAFFNTLPNIQNVCKISTAKLACFSPYKGEILRLVMNHTQFMIFFFSRFPPPTKLITFLPVRKWCVLDFLVHLEAQVLACG